MPILKLGLQDHPYSMYRGPIKSVCLLGKIRPTTRVNHQPQGIHVNIPILPEAFLTFASKSSIGPSYAAHGPYTQYNAMK